MLSSCSYQQETENEIWQQTGPKHLVQRKPVVNPPLNSGFASPYLATFPPEKLNTKHIQSWDKQPRCEKSKRNACKTLQALSISAFLLTFLRISFLLSQWQNWITTKHLSHLHLTHSHRRKKSSSGNSKLLTLTVTLFLSFVRTQHYQGSLEAGDKMVTSHYGF